MLKILEPVDVEGLLGIDAVVSKTFQKLIGNLAFLLKEVVDSFEELVRKRLHLGASVGVGSENVESVLLGVLVSWGKVQSADFKALGDDGMDSHRLFGALFGNADGDLVHLSLVVLFSLFLLVLLLLSLFVLSEVGGGLDAGEQPDCVISDGFAEFDQDVLLRYDPTLFLEVLDVIGEICEVGFLSLDFLFDDAGEGRGGFLDFAGEGVLRDGEECGGAEG